MLGLAFLKGDLLEGCALLVKDIGRNRVAIEVGGHVSGDVHRDIVGNACTCCVGDDEDTNLRRQVRAGLVQVEINVLALNADHAADLKLFADDSGHSIKLILNGGVAHGGCEQ